MTTHVMRLDILEPPMFGGLTQHPIFRFTRTVQLPYRINCNDRVAVIGNGTGEDDLGKVYVNVKSTLCILEISGIVVKLDCVCPHDICVDELCSELENSGWKKRNR